MKYYAVINGKEGNKIYTNWKMQAQPNISGAKGCVFKSFKMYDEAEAFINNNLESKVKEDEDLTDKLVIYVDGSWNSNIKQYSYGMVCLINDEIIYEEAKAGNSEIGIKSRNIAGELSGAVRAVQYAIDKKYKEVFIVYDYQGIESYVNGSWTPNTELTKLYMLTMKKLSKNIKIQFKKVKGHTGEEWNEYVDGLAKTILGIKVK